YIARILGERGEIKLLRLRSQLRCDFALESTRRFRQACRNPDVLSRFSQSASTCCLQKQDVKFTRNSSRDPRLNRSEVLGLELMPTRPKKLRCCGVSYSHVHPQQAGRAGLRAAGDNVIITTFDDPVTAVLGSTIIAHRLQREATPMPEQVSDKVLSEGF